MSSRIASRSAASVGEMATCWLMLSSLSFESCRTIAAIWNPAQNAGCQWPSTFIDQRCGALAEFLERRFEGAKLLRAEFGEHFFHLAGMFSKGGGNQILAARGKGHDPNAPVVGALHAADQALRDQAIDRDADRTGGQIDQRAYGIYGQGSAVQQNLQHSEIREAQPGLFDARGRIFGEGAHRLHHDQPGVVGSLKAASHKNLNPSEVYVINCIGVNIIDAK